MALITWNDNLSVKIDEIDNQHKKLIDLINQLHEAMKQGKAKDATGKIISGLVDYTMTHFDTEEKYFIKYSYPETESHKQEHLNFVRKVSDFKKDFESGKAMLSLQLTSFLKKWLVNHIKGTDQKYSNFLNEKGLN